MSDVEVIKTLKPKKVKRKPEIFINKKVDDIKDFSIEELKASPLFKKEYEEYIKCYKKYYKQEFDAKEIKEPCSLPDKDERLFKNLHKSYQHLHKILSQYESNKNISLQLFQEIKKDLKDYRSLSKILENKELTQKIQNMISKMIKRPIFLSNVFELGFALDQANRVKNSYKLKDKDIIIKEL